MLRAVKIEKSIVDDMRNILTLSLYALSNCRYVFNKLFKFEFV